MMSTLQNITILKMNPFLDAIREKLEQKL